MSLFPEESHARDERSTRSSGPAGEAPDPRDPLAHRARPRDLADLVGHSKLLASGQPLREWIDSDSVPSLVLWGPPGCGKTTLAQLIAGRTQARFTSMSALSAGVKDIQGAADLARLERATSGRETILFVDEIHRFNKSQQDTLLPHVERGVFRLIGATTENPSYELNVALLSRMQVVRLERLSDGDLEAILARALADPRLGLAGRLALSRDAIAWIASTSEGDARRALTALENVARGLARRRRPGERGPSGAASEPDRELTLAEAQRALESVIRAAIPYDKRGEEHYNLISAFIKSMRASDPDAAVYYLARMLEGGEDPLFVIRRMVVFAAEDVGNADPRALELAAACRAAVELVGMPEGRIPLAQVAIYLAVAPKSRASYDAIGAAERAVRERGGLPVPMHLRNASPSQADPALSELPRASGNLPESLGASRFYRPTDSGLEARIKESLKRR